MPLPKTASVSHNSMTAVEHIRMLWKLAKMGKRWNTTEEVRQKAVDVIDQVLEDPMMPARTKLQAVQILTAIEAQNQIDDRVSMEMQGRIEAKERVVLVLPMNGTEVGAEISAAGTDRAEGA